MFKKIDMYELVKKHRVSLLIASIIGLIIGVLSVIVPFAFGAVLIWVIIALVGICGIAAVVKFIAPGKGNTREPANLALGVLVILAVTALILIGVLGKSQVIQGKTYSSMEIMTVRILGFGSIFFGVFSIVNNIFLLCNLGNIVKEQRGLAIFKGILGIIVGILMCIFPFVMFAISIIIGGVYTIFSSLCLMIFDIKFWKSGKDNKEDYKL